MKEGTTNLIGGCSPANRRLGIDPGKWVTHTVGDGT